MYLSPTDYAQENIRVNAVCPGDVFVTRWIDRDREQVLEPHENTADVSDEEIARRLRTSCVIPMGRVGEVDEVAKVLFCFVLFFGLFIYLFIFCIRVCG